MKYFLTALTIFLFSSCSNSFINHSLKAEKIGDCTNDAVPVKMISNINGERYEFQLCIDANFDGKNYTVTRNGDSLLVNFPQSSITKSQYKLILDIDAKPAYHHITLGTGGQTITVVPAERL